MLGLKLIHVSKMDHRCEQDAHAQARQPLQAITSLRHQTETFSALLALCVENSPVNGEFPSQRSVTRSFDASFDLRLYTRLSKQS